MIRALNQYLAKRRLQRITEERAKSYATTDYRIRRAAAKAGWAKRRAGA